MNILIIDTDSELIEIYKDFLEDNISEVNVKTYNDWAKIKDIKKNELIFEILLTNMSDEKIANNLIIDLKKNNKNIKVIIVTGNYDNLKYRDCFDYFLWKPIDLKVLLKIIKKTN